MIEDPAQTRRTRCIGLGASEPVMVEFRQALVRGGHELGRGRWQEVQHRIGIAGTRVTIGRRASLSLLILGSYTDIPILSPVDFLSRFFPEQPETSEL